MSDQQWLNYAKGHASTTSLYNIQGGRVYKLTVERMHWIMCYTALSWSTFGVKIESKCVMSTAL